MNLRRVQVSALLVVAALSGGAAYAGLSTYDVYVVSPASVSQPLAIVSATAGGEPCSNFGSYAVCPTASLGIGGSYVITVVVRNPTAAAETVSVNATSANEAVVTVAADHGNPSSIQAGATAQFSFTVTGVGGGTANVRVEVGD